MDYIKEYKIFISSYYLSEGLRITAGVALPALVFSYFGLLSVGTVVSLGALCVSSADSPGPIHHRRNGMMACTVIIFFVCLITGYIAPHPLLLGFLIAAFCFLFCMIGVYGGRVISIGVAALLVMVLNIDRSVQGWNVLLNAVWVAAGGAWYMMLSLALYHVRPYKLIQQALGDCIMATADYLRSRARFYDSNEHYDHVYVQLMEKQAQVQQKQHLLRELLFKNRTLLKESTTASRTLMMIFIDTVDFFEKTTTSFYPYESLHHFFDDTDILPRFKHMLLGVADALDDTGIAVQAGRISTPPIQLQEQLTALKEYFTGFRDAHIKAVNLEALITLRKILQAIEDLSSRINTLHHHTLYDKPKAKAFMPRENYDLFVTPTDMNWKLLRDNLSAQSDIFRHALRVSIAATAGYILSQVLVLGHSYWILLTIIVILKPAYSLTQKRNYQRLIGTVSGAAVGLIILFFIKDRTVLFFIMLVLMTGTYSFLRTNYLVSVLCMTPYILLLFHLLDSGHFKTILMDRVIDTGIGSAIAFAANFLLVPAWEHEQIKKYMVAAIKSCLAYYKTVSFPFTGTGISDLEFKLSRKEAFVSLANLSEAFSRMLAEPKSKQKDSKAVHQLVVLTHTLTSHIATLSHFGKTLAVKYRSPEFESIILQTENNLMMSADLMEDGVTTISHPVESSIPFALDKQVKELVEKRNTELSMGLSDTETKIRLSELKPIADQFVFIAAIAQDIIKIASSGFTELKKPA